LPSIPVPIVVSGDGKKGKHWTKEASGDGLPDFLSRGQDAADDHRTCFCMQPMKKERGKQSE
jgi:hypothetical protein